MMPDLPRLQAAVEATWPAARIQTLGPVTIREGRGGGKRVSAATASRALAPEELAAAEAAMRDLGQDALFQIRAGDAALDANLAEQGYRSVDPTNMHAAPVAILTTQTPAPRDHVCGLGAAGNHA